MKTIFPLALLCSLLSACGNGSDDLDQWMQDQNSHLKGQVEPIPALQQPISADFTAYGLLSPFDPNRLKQAGGRNAANAPDLARPRDALENYDLERLKMVGSLQIKGQRHGLVLAPDGMVYTVMPGRFVGNNFGMVTAVTENEIKLQETVEDANGEWSKRETSLLLTEGQGQQK